MTCRKCTHEFCWICSKDWRRHGEAAYECNKYNDKEESKRNQADSVLRRYLFHYERYNNHAQSLKLQINLKSKVKEIMKYMQEKATMGFAESQFFETAIETLESCRTVLMNTYIFAYYVKKNNHLDIFENNQRDLEIAVEKLCAHLEQDDPSTMDITYLKQRVQDLTRYCNRRKEVLILHVEEGFDKGNCWLYNEAGCD